MRNSSRNNVRPSVPRNVTWLSCLPLDVSKGLAGRDRWAHIHRLLRTGPRIICAEERCHDNKDRLWNDTLYQSDVERRKTNQLQFNEEWNWGKWKRKWKCVITCCTIVCACSLLIEAKESNSLFSVHLTNTLIHMLLMAVHLFAKSNQTHLWFVWDREASTFFWLVVGIVH